MLVGFGEGWDTVGALMRVQRRLESGAGAVAACLCWGVLGTGQGVEARRPGLQAILRFRK